MIANPLKTIFKDPLCKIAKRKGLGNPLEILYKKKKSCLEKMVMSQPLLLKNQLKENSTFWGFTLGSNILESFIEPP